MRVCFLVERLGRSGGAATIRSYAARLPELGWDVDVVPTDPGATPPAHHARATAGAGATDSRKRSSSSIRPSQR